MKPGIWGGGSENAFFINDVNPDNSYLELMYSKMYFLINNANHVITKTELLNTEDSRKEEIIAEAEVFESAGTFLFT